MTKLRDARGNGTSMISLIIPAGKDISIYKRLLNTEYGTASKIRDRVNRQSVQSAIVSARERLNTYNKTPMNGLALFCGEIVTEKGIKKIVQDIEPFKPVRQSLYLCDSRFHIEPLEELIAYNEDSYGFIIIDGHGTLYGTIAGNTSNVIGKFSVALPKRQSHGGQSALRYARIRSEKRRNYYRKIAENAVKYFITNDSVNVKGIIIASVAGIGRDFINSELLDQRLQGMIINSSITVDVGDITGFYNAINGCKEILQGQRVIFELKLLQKFFAQIAQNSDMLAYGIDKITEAFNIGAIDTIIVWENLQHNRYSLYNSVTDEHIVRIDKNPESFETFIRNGFILESEELYINWLVENYKSKGSKIVIVSDTTPDGTRFVNGFDGIGAFLRYPLTSQYYDEI